MIPACVEALLLNATRGPPIFRNHGQVHEHMIPGCVEALLLRATGRQKPLCLGIKRAINFQKSWARALTHDACLRCGPTSQGLGSSETVVLGNEQMTPAICRLPSITGGVHSDVTRLKISYRSPTYSEGAQTNVGPNFSSQLVLF